MPPSVASKTLPAPARSEQSEERAANLAGDLAGDLARDWAQYLAGDLAGDLARYWARYLAGDLAGDWARYWARYWARDWARDWAQDLAWYLARDWARDWARESALDPDEPAHIDFALWELGSLGRPSARARLAMLDPSSPKYSLPVELELLKAACRLSLHPDSPPDEFNNALAEYDMLRQAEPLWPALARHLTRRATPEDKALLEDLAQHPEKRDPPLSWGLRYIVRGDILMEDGTVVTIDELCDQLNLPRLPYIEDLPPELEIDWEHEKPPRKQQAKKKSKAPKPPQEKPKKKAAKKKAVKKKAAKKKGSSAGR